VSAAHLEPLADPALVARLGPSVIAGDPQHLVALLTAARADGHRLPNLRTVLAVGDPLGADMRARIRSLSGGAVVVGAWAPPGVRSLWSECRPGAEAAAPVGYHAWPDDVLEVAHDGELLWTGVGWHGSALLRLRTFAAVSVEHDRCAACGDHGPRVVPLAPVPRAGGDDAVVEPAAEEPEPADASHVAAAGAEAVLDAETDVAAWQVEYRVFGGEPETIVSIAPAWGAAVVPLVRRLDRHLRATQFIVLTAEEIAARVDAAGGRIVDGRDAGPG
jgi:hypothetical protein